jgi:hypothetical protein
MFEKLKKKIDYFERSILCVFAISSILFASLLLLKEKVFLFTHRFVPVQYFSLSINEKQIVHLDKISVYMLLTILLILAFIFVILRNNWGLIVSQIFIVCGLVLLTSFTLSDNLFSQELQSWQKNPPDRLTICLQISLLVFIVSETVILCKNMRSARVDR